MYVNKSVQNTQPNDKGGIGETTKMKRLAIAHLFNP